MILNSQSEEIFEIDLYQNILYKYDLNSRAFHITRKDLGLKNSDLEMLSLNEFVQNERRLSNLNQGNDFLEYS